MFTPTSRVGVSSTLSSPAVSPAFSLCISCLRTSGLLGVGAVALVASFGRFSAGYILVHAYLAQVRIFEMSTAHPAVLVQLNVLPSNMVQPLLQENFVGQWKKVERELVISI